MSKHGLIKTREYKLWKNIKQRCYNINSKRYCDYGGRGIKMYIHWLNDPKFFIDYIKSLDDYNKEGYTLDRINNDGDYELGNLRWTSKSEQSINRRKSKNNTSGYTGVSFRKTTDKYVSKITVNRQIIHLGLYNTPEYALEVRNEYILKNNLSHKIQKII